MNHNDPKNTPSNEIYESDLINDMQNGITIKLRRYLIRITSILILRIIIITFMHHHNHTNGCLLESLDRTSCFDEFINE